MMAEFLLVRYRVILIARTFSSLVCAHQLDRRLEGFIRNVDDEIPAFDLVEDILKFQFARDIVR